MRAAGSLVTVGVDLAAEPTGTAVVAITWHAAGARAEVVFDGQKSKPEDDDLLRVLGDERYAKVGVDCPFGWPVGFVDAVLAHDRGRPWPGGAGGDARRHLRYRLTDHAVHERFPGDRWPLSVSSDLIGVNAMRWASIAQRYEDDHGPIDRTGGGTLVEVYPAAAMRHWQVHVEGYKADNAKAVGKRHEVVHLLHRSLPGLVPQQLVVAMEHKKLGDDVLDALIAALVAGAASVDATDPPPPVGTARRRTAETEGWIAVPEPGLTLTALADRLGP